MRTLSKQTKLLVLVGVLFAASLVLVLVVVLSGDDGPAKGSPDRLTDDFAAALRANSASRVSGLACAASRAEVLRTSKNVLGGTTAADRQGNASITGDNGAARITLTNKGKALVGTVAMGRTTGAWCVQAFLAAVPVH